MRLRKPVGLSGPILSSLLLSLLYFDTFYSAYFLSIYKREQFVLYHEKADMLEAGLWDRTGWDRHCFFSLDLLPPCPFRIPHPFLSPSSWK